MVLKKPQRITFVPISIFCVKFCKELETTKVNIGNRLFRYLGKAKPHEARSFITCFDTIELKPTKMLNLLCKKFHSMTKYQSLLKKKMKNFTLN